MVLLKEIEHDPDFSLVEACQNGDSTAFDELVRRHKDRIYHVVYRYVGNHEDAQDVAQEAFVRAYRGIRGFRGASRVYTWLHSIAGNLARNKLRDGQRRGRNHGVSLDALESTAPDAAQRHASTAKTPDLAAREREMDEVLQACLDELPEHYRMPFVLRTFDNMSYDEIAEVLGCPTGTVKSRLNQARTLLHEKLIERRVL